MVARDFTRTYDKIDLRLLSARLADLGIPACTNTWVWNFLRDRRACVELQGRRSGERVYRAGLPHGSVLSPTLFLLWSAPLVSALRALPGTTPLHFADDTSTLFGGVVGQHDSRGAGAGPVGCVHPRALGPPE